MHRVPVMWLEGPRLQVIDSALEGQTADIDRVLADILAGAQAQDAVPSSCPSCRRDLVRHRLPAAGLFVSRCPEGHGAWMDASVADALQRFVETHVGVAARRRHQIRLLRGLMVVLAVALAGALLFTHGGQVVVGSVEAVEAVQNRFVGETYWPSRGWMYKLFSIPIKESSIDRHAELAYFVALLPILDEGITHRINIDGVLRTRRSPAEYSRLYDLYRDRQTVVLSRLERLDPPERLRPVHDRIRVAAAEQIDFYERFARAKALDSRVGLDAMLGDRGLQATNTQLHTAWEEIRRLYPDLDPDTSTAIELRFCGFDVL